MICLNVPNFLYKLYQRKITFSLFKMRKTCNFLKESNKLRFFTQEVGFRRYKENWEHLNVSFRIFFVKHFLSISGTTF